MRGLLLLHGFLGGPWSFDAIRSGLVGHRSVMAPTLSYHGPVQDQTPFPLDFGGEVRRLAALLERSGLAPVDLVGYSMGGRLALGLCVTRPELVQRLILISSRRGLDSLQERELRQRDDENWAGLLETAGLETFLNRWWAQPLFRTLTELPKPTLQAELACRRHHDAASLAAALRYLGLGRQPSYAEEVRRLGVPTTLVAGGYDDKFRDLSRRLAAEVPHGRIIVVEGAGHQLLLEAPAQIAQIIDEEANR